MKPYRALVLTWLWLSAVLMLRAQGYSGPDVSRFHYSSAYYVTLQDADGKSISDLYSRTEGVIGAFVGGELRGVSEVVYTDAAGGNPVFVIRVWGDDADESAVTFRIRDARYGLEYVLDRRLFARGEDMTYGEPSHPIVMQLTPIDGITLASGYTVVQGGTTSARAAFTPTEHSELLSQLRTEYQSSDESIFTVSADGIITGQKRGQATVYVNVYLGDRLCFRAQAYVSVLDDKIAVTGLRNDMSSLDIVKREGDRFQLAFTVLPENATNRMVTYSLGDYSIINIIQEDEYAPATFVAAKVGQTTITVKTAEGGYTLTYNVTVEENPDLVVHVKSLTVSPTEVEVFTDDTFDFTYTVQPANATDKTVSISIADETVVSDMGGGIYKGLKPGQTTITVTSRDNAEAQASLTVTVKAVPAVTLQFAQTDVVLSKLHDTALTLTASEPAKLLPARVELVFDNHPNTGWGTVATASATDDSGLRWKARARYVGNYVAHIRYNGTLQASTCNVHVPAEYPFEPGWDWLSLHTVSADQGYAIPLTSELKARLTKSDEDGVVEIRTQYGVLAYDPEVGFFGDIDRFSPTEGTYKLYTVFPDSDDDDDDLSAYADRMYLSTSYTNLVNSSTLSLPLMGDGYIWVTYPHELDHSLEALAPYLSQSAYDEDKIIAKNGFAEFDGEDWIATEGFSFKAGKGYLYYCSSEGGKAINWGPVTMAPEGVAPLSAPKGTTTDPALPSKTIEAPSGAVGGAGTSGSQGAGISPFLTSRSSHPDCMAVVARFDDVDRPEDYLVGAFVGQECRGEGRTARNGLTYLAVSGRAGEQVSFRLYHLPSGRYVDVADELFVRFRGSVGSHNSPLVLKASAQGISESAADSRLQLSIVGDRVLLNGSTGAPRIIVVDAQGKTVARSAGTSLTLPRLSHGVYVVRATDGSAQVIKKVNK